MSGRPFLDTNILIYAFSRDDIRTPIALSLLGSGGVITVQILNEMINVSRKKLARSWDEIDRQLVLVRTLLDPPLSLTPEDQDRAVSIAKRFGFDIFDSQMVASAVTARCDTLYTEDLQHGQVIEGLTIRNPFIS